MTKRVIEGEQSIMGTIFFIFKVNTVERVLRDLFQSMTFSLTHVVPGPRLGTSLLGGGSNVTG